MSTATTPRYIPYCHGLMWRVMDRFEGTFAAWRLFGGVKPREWHTPDMAVEWADAMNRPGQDRNASPSPIVGGTVVWVNVWVR